MTAEVVIINRQAVALAADSAVTIGRQRVWKYANKLFSAGPYNDIGVMIYNTGDYLGTPWEVIVKEFRRNIGERIFDYLEDFAVEFRDFVKSDRFYDKKQASISVQLIIIDVFEELAQQVRTDKRKNLIADLPDKIAREMKDLEDTEQLDDKPSLEEFLREYSRDLKDLAFDIFEHRLPKDSLDALADLVHRHLLSKSESEFGTGIVIAGYGKLERFPVVCEYIVDGRWQKLTRIWKDRSVDFNGEDPPDAGILPFAQADMASLFVEGVYPRYKTFLEEF